MMVNLRFIYTFLILFLLLVKFDIGNAVKDLKKTHSAISFQKKEKTNPYDGKSSSYVARLETKYKPDYGVDEIGERKSYSTSYIQHLERESYHPTSYYAPVESKDEETNSSPSTVREHRNMGNNGQEDEIGERKSYSPSYIQRLERESYHPTSYYAPVEEDEIGERKSYSPSYIQRLERESYHPTSYYAPVESKYESSYSVVKDEETNSSPSTVEHRNMGNNGQEDEIGERKSYSPSYIQRLERESYHPTSYYAPVESKYESSYSVVKDEETNSSPSTVLENRNMGNNGQEDDIGSEDVGVFTIDDVRAFSVGRKLSTFFSIRNPSLYPGFLPREVADSAPFSSSEIDKILQFFSVSPDSPKGKEVKLTLRKCETKPIKGVTKICATSSESMFEFLQNAFEPGVDFKLISTSHPTMTKPTLQSYTILELPQEIESPKKVACHPLPYFYAVYMCHYDATETKVFKVPLVGDNGDKVDALIVCHLDTSNWSPKHSAFSLLGTKPGIPVCHTFSEGHGVWIQSSPVASM